MKAALDYVSDVATQTTILAKRMTEIQYRTVKGPYQQTIRAKCSFIEVLIYMNKTLKWSHTRAKNKDEVHLGNPKSGRCRLREL